MRKTYSQNVARFFEIADYFLLVPSVLGLFCAGYPVWINPQWFFNAFFIVILLIFVVGFCLLIGFLKHSRHEIPRNSRILLWIFTIIFNLLLAIPILIFLFSTLLNNRTTNPTNTFFPSVFLIILSMPLWNLTAVFVALTALRSDLQRLN